MNTKLWIWNLKTSFFALSQVTHNKLGGYRGAPLSTKYLMYNKTVFLCASINVLVFNKLLYKYFHAYCVTVIQNIYISSKRKQRIGRNHNCHIHVYILAARIKYYNKCSRKIHIVKHEIVLCRLLIGIYPFALV